MSCFFVFFFMTSWSGGGFFLLQHDKVWRWGAWGLKSQKSMKSFRYSPTCMLYELDFISLVWGLTWRQRQHHAYYTTFDTYFIPITFLTFFRLWIIVKPGLVRDQLRIQDFNISTKKSRTSSINNQLSKMETKSKYLNMNTAFGWVVSK